ncbi:DUF4440 domain-containing protein [Salegentibacter sp. F188]|uniref:DUF4440 domain-containing protein n=1 Tax=Autumnicola patrickiae TaxID=3075591 RepID=A0ABU3DZL8_9FLAO|nr:nuclear transport factor 2 family protein [Salegentibacter sp. F188]MDT0689147.1 DUF4440 domain-containing protein [Salegentibacter sp. F188]
MKTTIQFLLLLLISASAGAQTLEKDNEKLIKELISDSFDDIFSNLDPEKLSDYYTEDFLLLENGEVWNNEIIISYMEKAQGQRQPQRINSFNFIEIKIQDKMAWVAYHNNARFMMGEKLAGEMNWLESATAILTEDGWKLQMLHSTLIEEEHD